MSKKCSGGGPLEEIGQVVIKTKLGDLRGLEVAVHPMFTHPELMNAEPPTTAHAFLNVNYSDPVPRFSVSQLCIWWSIGWLKCRLGAVTV